MAIGLVSLAALIFGKRLPEPLLVAAGALAGIALYR
jgi:hypothetical protein